MIALYLIPIILLFRQYNKYRVSLLTEKTEADLSKSLNKLRLFAIDGRIDNESVGYMATDIFITNSMNHLKRANIWLLLYISVKSEAKEKKIKVDTPPAIVDMHFNSEYLNEIYSDSMNTVLTYLGQKSISILIIRKLAKCANWFRNFFNNNGMNNIGSLRNKLRDIWMTRELSLQNEATNW